MIAKTATRKCYGYIRVSTRDQAEKKYGLHAQRQQVRAFYRFLKSKPENADLEWGGLVIEKAQSAYRIPFRQRKKGRKLHRVAKGGDVLIFARLDRAFRRGLDCKQTIERWLKQGVTAHFVNPGIDISTAYGRMIIAILTAVAEMDSEYKSERGKETAAIQRAKHKPRNQHVAIGHRVVGRAKAKFIIPDRKQAPIIRLIVLYRERHKLSYGVISDRIEHLLARREKRDPLPGVVIWGKRKRVWSRPRCFKAHRAAKAGSISYLRPRPWNVAALAT